METGLDLQPVCVCQEEKDLAPRTEPAWSTLFPDVF